MLVEIEAKCGQCIVCKSLCPFEYYGSQSSDDFCNHSKAYSEKCDYCISHTMDHPWTGSHMCNNYYFCGLAEEVMNWRKNNVPMKTRGAYNMAVELEFIKGEQQ